MLRTFCPGQLKYPHFRTSASLTTDILSPLRGHSAMIKKFGEFELDETLRRLTRGGHQVQLTGQALEVLCLLVNRPGEVVSRREIEHSLWPDSNVDFQHSLDVLLHRLRTALGDSGKNPRYIETVPKRGYRFLASVGSASTYSYRQRIENSFRSLWTYAMIALLASTISVLILHTRYQKFIPPEHVPVRTDPLPH